MTGTSPKAFETAGDDGLGRRAFAAHVAEHLAEQARAILGFQDLLVEQARELGLAALLPDLERVSAAAEALDRLIDGLIERGLEGERPVDAEVEARLRHDLRTPLNAIIGYSEMIAEELADLPHPGLAGDLDVILDEARALLGRIDEIVDFRRADAAGATGGAAAQAELVAAGLATTLGGAVETARTGPGRILVVDDVASNRDLLSRRLGRDGHEVLLAESGTTALRLLEAEAVDLILLDILMPDMNGIEMLSHLRAHPEWARLPVIMISGLKEADAVIRCIEAGADDYLTKPFNPVLLRARVNACLERKRWADREQRYLRRIEAEKERADALLQAILPMPVVARLTDGERIIADRFESVTILFADLVGFTPVATRTSATRLVRRLDCIFRAFDGLAEEHGVEKIKTIGDAYMAAAGVPDQCDDHAERAMRLAWAMLEAVGHADPDSPPFQLRIGVHSGPVVAGLIGRSRFVYDVWGETVNIASRLEFHGEPGCIQMSEGTFRALDGRWPAQPVGLINLKGVGDVSAYRIGRDTSSTRSGEPGFSRAVIEQAADSTG